MLVAIALPWLFYDWAHGRQSGFVISMLSQMGMMVIFALSYNMLMGQAGLLSLCHAVMFGFGGYCMIHFLNAAGDGALARADGAVAAAVWRRRSRHRHRVRLHGDAPARHRLRDDHAGHWSV